MSQKAIFVDAMIGVCVNDPKALVEPPSNVKQFFGKVINTQYKNASLSPEAKVGYITIRGTKSFEEREKQVWNDLPKQMQTFMTNNGLDPNAYDMKSFSEDLGKDLKIIFMAAFQKDTRSENKRWRFWK